MPDPVRPAPPEPVLAPELPICDAHHHLWRDRGDARGPYLLADLHADTATGHHVVQTVFVECHAEYRVDGPAHLRPVGEVAFAAEIAEESVATRGPEITAIIGHADLTLGDAVEDVLRAEDEAGRGRFRGVRFTTAWDPAPLGNNGPRAGVMGEEPFRRGVRRLGALGYSYDVMCFHTQLPELVELARACPEVTIVANHLGVPIASGPYRGRAEEVRARWRPDLARLATCDNVVLKIGALMRPLTGDRWDRGGQLPASDEVAAAWGPDIRHAIDCFGPSRCLFESNFPVDKACVGYAQLWNAFKRIAAHLDPGEQRDIFHDTAARTYRLATLA